MNEENEYDRIQQLEDIIRVNEEKNEDDNAALVREISKLWNAIDEINDMIKRDSEE